MTMTTAALTGRAHDGVVPDDDPAAKPVRRRFTLAYKLAILDEYSDTTDPGAKGALLRREGLYSSHIVEWRRARDAGALAQGALLPRRSKRSAERAEIERLKRKTERLESQLAKHRQAIEIQGKASEALSRLLAEATEETSQQPKRHEP
jgi:transposase-like protein